MINDCCEICNSSTNVYLHEYSVRRICKACDKFWERTRCKTETVVCINSNGKCLTTNEIRRCQNCRLIKCKELIKKRKFIKELKVTEICKICEAKEISGIHYKVRTCECCKTFFRRHCQKKEFSTPYKCDEHSPDKKRPNKCRKCRWEKCLVSGMTYESNKRGRHSKLELENYQSKMLKKAPKICQSIIDDQIQRDLSQLFFAIDIFEEKCCVRDNTNSSTKILRNILHFASYLPNFSLYSKEERSICIDNSRYVLEELLQNDFNTKLLVSDKYELNEKEKKFLLCFFVANPAWKTNSSPVHYFQNVLYYLMLGRAIFPAGFLLNLSKLRFQLIHQNDALKSEIVRCDNFLNRFTQKEIRERNETDNESSLGRMRESLTKQLLNDVMMEAQLTPMNKDENMRTRKEVTNETINSIFSIDRQPFIH